MLVNLNDVLADAKKNHYGVGLFNTIDTDMLEAAISAAEELRSPIIIGTAEVLLPFGELKLITPSFVEAAKRASVPVVLHYDHGVTFEKCMEALQLGFSSVMFDGSASEYSKNIADTAEVVKVAHAFGATVEGEIGHVGQAADGDNTSVDLYTQVSEAVAYQKATGVDALAVSIGTAHGAYKSAPKLDLQRLSDIRDAVDVPLVLHGGSGLSDDDFRNAIAHGISKVNIFTDICRVGMEANAKMLETNPPFNSMWTYLNLRNDRVAAMKEEIKTKIKLFGSVGKA
ncbi:MAG: class II fructose-bisphosphate aldolase [Ruminococcaceae bacterium]|nr:class II fructose-bisphosphate aldolase [Oscillospiraceae bacterium]